MLVWIVDDDVSFAYGFRDDLAADDRKIEVFLDVESFLDGARKIKKEKQPLPDVVFMDVEMPGKKGTDLYFDLKAGRDPLAEKFYFCSAISYGRFEEIFLSRGMQPPPFVQKSRLSQEAEEILQGCRPKEELKQERPAFAHPMARKKMKELEALKERMVDLYYKGAFGEGEVKAFIQMAEKIGALAGALSIPGISAAALGLTVALAKPEIGMARVKKEARDFVKLLEKEKDLSRHG